MSPEKETNMKKIALFGSACGLLLVAAAPPSGWNGASAEISDGYPPCSATVTDRCIQLYERGVATPANLALNERLGINQPGVGLAAMGGPYEPVEEADDYAAAWSDHEQPVADDWEPEEEEFAAYDAPYDDGVYYEEDEGPVAGGMD